MNLFDPIVLLTLALAVAIIAAGVLAWKLHEAGVPNNQLAKQTGIKAGNMADALRDKIVAVMTEEAAKLAAKATLQDVYFDEANFMQDLGRLPPSFAQAVSLKPVNGEAKIERDGTMPPLQYAVQANGNVTKA